ncbi:HAMP domain-containing sensor histidine kinase [Streptomyces sp. V1I1]|uniref:sensor histidine kinase n=1 Tax=Streptomyces sp. V1I1 TaxID=3042272 RepID=UPI0027862DB9|nr:HAMP domain-containing sensor histidine kinase [Streptomyces sp. V1I1]MDQ0938810.1 two-component system sensor histidine kinase PrrB [Streptomyces sp. V1I1]
MKLSTRIALAVGATVPVLVLAAGWLLLQLVSRDLHAEQDTHLRERAVVVAKDARRLLRATAADRPAVVEQARERQLYASGLDVGIRLTGPQGTVSGGPQPDASVPLPDSTRGPVTVEDGARSWRVLMVRVQGSRPGVDGTLWLFSPDTTSEDQLALVRRRVVTVALLAAPISGLLALAVASRASRPLRRLQQRTNGLDPRADTARLDHTRTGVTEVDDLARTLQTVLARYDEQAARTTGALATARSFAAAAAHELRTPLMSMQTNLEILTEHPDLGPADRAEVLDDLHSEHSRLLGLLVMLRELGRGDLIEADAFGRVDLAEVIDASVADARRRHSAVEITVPVMPRLSVHGWEPGVRTIVDNLLANAMVHGRDSDGRARIELGLRGGGHPAGSVAVLTVDDRGPGIAPSRRDTVFHRFERRPDSPGSGLGLTLVAQQTALHAGRVQVQDRPGGSGTRIEVRLPVRESRQTEILLPAERDWLIGTAEHPQGFHKDSS